MSEQKYFKEALGNFVHDAAAGGAIRHLADLGYTVGEITEKLDWPTPKERVGQTVFDHYVDTGKICLREPDGKPIIKYHYKKTQSPTGKTGLVRVSEEVPTDDRKYVKVDFGKRIYKDRDGFAESLKEAGLKSRDIDFILDLPWPLQEVWYQMDERMERILRTKIGARYRQP